ncbi:hypothetical protein IVB27_32285 [Bradyrhizobium sp. 197]|uniref:hypothetical protein n=1 Tax=Bradyrhizobium sp. 197 TaxID=2782663 RepID=UPI001FFBCB96|nr:hypothetical protein [Bradyrhizobium sp. 197]MCK1479293.1 hypothetical protein [Bradyrhizobium sp. 197]
MTFNQWAAATGISALPASAKSACEAIWDALVRRGASTGEASILLTDLAHSLPKRELSGGFFDEDEGDYD